MPQSQCQGSSLDKPPAVATRSPSDGSTLRRAGGGGGGGPASATSSPEHSDHALSASSDSGLSNASLWTERGSLPLSSTSSSTTATTKASGPSPQEKAELRRLLSGFGLDEPAAMFHKDGMDGVTPVEGIHRAAAAGHPAQVHQHHAGGRSQLPAKERETDILDDEEVLLMSGHDLRSVDSLGTLSSSYHESSQNSLLSDGFGSPGGPEDVVAHHQHQHQHQHLNHHGHQYFQNQHQQHNNHHHQTAVGAEDYERAYGEPRRGCLGQRSASVPAASSPSPSPSPCGTGPRAGSFRQGGYSTHTWVQQQQMVAAQQYSYLPEEVAVEGAAMPMDVYSHGGEQGASPSPEPPAGAAEQSNGTNVVAETAISQTAVDKSHDEEFNSLTVDIDNSIDQLNQLIMDLDPTFVPIPTRTGSVKRNGGAPANGPTTACTNGTSHRVSGTSRAGVQQAGKVPQASLGRP